MITWLRGGVYLERGGKGRRGEGGTVWGRGEKSDEEVGKKGRDGRGRHGKEEEGKEGEALGRK